MNNRVLGIFLGAGLLLCLTIFLTSYANNVRLPGNNEGYEPVQPIAYSHRLHAGELQLACLHCHSDAGRSRNAGIPTMQTCMDCHKFVTAPILDIRAEDRRAAEAKEKPKRIVSAELHKLYAAMGLDDQLRPEPGAVPRAVGWIRVHELPDFVYFNHGAHVSAGAECQTCHGAIETMERVRQVSDLSMGWCVNCHRGSNATGVQGRAVAAPTDCSGCHF
ncbi:MAG TPA: cytochrome c3 family protein [Bacteroidota bacterium]|nr:cytochrome c3 family protein [Bacteroidota bacterium]